MASDYDYKNSKDRRLIGKQKPKNKKGQDDIMVIRSQKSKDKTI
jgi:hypothetical protein